MEDLSAAPPVEEFLFPYRPYPIQKDFMQTLYLAISEKKVALLESPTGTGKSLSLLCGAIKWIKDHQEEPPSLESSIDNEETKPDSIVRSSMPSWIRDHLAEKKKSEKEKAKKEYLDARRDLESKLAIIRLNREMQSPVLKKRKIVLEVGKSVHRKSSIVNQHGQEEIDVNYQRDVLGRNREGEDVLARKVFYCSRTHSQLAQIVKECQRTKWFEKIRLVVLGSRGMMCINPEIRNLPSLNQINDKCLDMVGSKVSKTQLIVNEDVDSSPTPSTRCPFFNDDIQTLKYQILAQPMDVEELITNSKESNACPYYATRSAIRSSEFVLLPYHTLLHKPTRESLDIDLKNNIVILDEAHNVVNAINAIHSIELKLSSISQALAQLTQYLDRHKTKLRADDSSLIQKIVLVLKCLVKYLSPSSTASEVTQTSSPNSVSNQSIEHEKQSCATSILSLNEFLFQSQLDNLNLFQLDHYMRESRLAQKVQGSHPAPEIDVKVMKDHRSIHIELDPSEFERHRPALGLVNEFLMCLVNQDSDGKILTTINSNNPRRSSVKYILLNPEIHFRDILTQTRSVILAGGTMQPFDELVDHLFPIFPCSPKLSPERLVTLQCPHIIPKSHLLTLVAPVGPTGFDFHFTFEHQHNQLMIEELGRLIANVSSVVPDGIVVFLPSYQYEKSVISVWKNSDTWEKISSKKSIFQEPKHAGLVDQTLQDYAKAIETSTKNGAILMCVVGGKLSEGINFKDKLGRCVVMVGLPYPNARDPIMLEKMAFIEHRVHLKSIQQNQTNKHSKNDYYQNLCMKAVNQSIGRSIRHAKDYATILLVDRRYLHHSIQSRLPEWIKSSISKTQTFGGILKSIADFFKGHASKRKMDA